jgi:hypothetical protein
MLRLIARMTTISAQVSNSRKAVDEDSMMWSRLWLLRAGKSAVLFVLRGLVLGFATDISSAQAKSLPIKVESHEVVVPVEVIQETKDPKGIMSDSNGNLRAVWILRFNQIANLTAKSVHIFEDGVEQSIQHFSFEQLHAWGVSDNTGRHQEYSCTPRGLWAGPNITLSSFYFDDSRLHTYLVTYVPPPSVEGSCHRIAVKVDRKHATVFAPDQYCNTNDPLSDPLKDTKLGNELVSYAKSEEHGSLPLLVQVNSFKSSAGVARIDLSAAMPPNLLKRKWEGGILKSSIAILGLVFDQHNEVAARFTDIACLPAENTMGYQGPFPLPGNIMEVFEQLAIPSSYRTQFALKPGDYRVELVLTDGEKFGRATSPITVDDFTKEPLSISGVALCKRYHKPSPDERGPTRAPQYEPLIFDDTEFTPAGDTRFHKDEPCISFFEIYGSQLDDAAVAMHLQVKITDAKTGEVKLDSGVEPLNFGSVPKNNSIPVVRTVSIDALSPGSYRLEAQVSDSAGHKTEWRAASFTVE